MMFFINCVKPHFMKSSKPSFAKEILKGYGAAEAIMDAIDKNREDFFKGKKIIVKIPATETRPERLITINYNPPEFR